MEHSQGLGGNSESESVPTEGCLFLFLLSVMRQPPPKVPRPRLLPMVEVEEIYLPPSIAFQGVQHSHLQTYICVDLSDVCCVVWVGVVCCFMDVTFVVY